MADELIEHFERLARNPSQWRAQARELKLASDMIAKMMYPAWLKYERTALALHSVPSEQAEEAAMAHLRALSDPIAHQQDVWLLLVGYSLEVAAKGVLVAQDVDRWIGPVARPTDKPLRDLLRSHRVTQLISEAGIDLEGEAQAAVQQAELRVTWMGRYPIPVSPAGLRSDGDDAPIVSHRLDRRWGRLLHNVYGRLESRLDELIAQSQ